MIRLMVIRHAKSSWKGEFESDHARPLNKRGKRDAPNVAAYLESIEWVPSLAISSDSKRTKQTWKRMREVFGAGKSEYTQAFYHASVEDVLPILADVESVETLAIVGHNPGWEALVEWLVGDAVKLSTCNVVLLTSKSNSWEHATSKSGRWKIVEVVRPKDLPTEFS